VRPKPALRPHPPVFVGGSGPTVFDRVPAFGGAWAPNWNHVVDNLERRIAEAVCRWAAQNPAEPGLEIPGLVPGGDSAGGKLTFAPSVALRDRLAALPVLAQPASYPSTDETRSYLSEQTFAEGYLLIEADRRWFRKHNQTTSSTDRPRPGTPPRGCLYRCPVVWGVGPGASTRLARSWRRSASMLDSSAVQTRRIGPGAPGMG
jgi:acetyl esterase/lipase